jgi:hypothetical protein
MMVTGAGKTAFSSFHASAAYLGARLGEIASSGRRGAVAAVQGASATPTSSSVGSGSGTAPAVSNVAEKAAQRVVSAGQQAADGEVAFRYSGDFLLPFESAGSSRDRPAQAQASGMAKDTLPDDPVAKRVAEAERRRRGALNDGQQTEVLTEHFIKQAEEEVSNASQSAPSSAARARESIAMARIFASNGELLAARLAAEEASRQADPESATADPVEKLKSALGQKKANDDGGEDTGILAEGQPGTATYVDNSNDPNASMRSPVALTAGEAELAVRMHERGHLMHAEADARTNGEQIVSAHTQIRYRVNPNTGEIYASGGEAVVTTKARQRQRQQNQLRSWAA